MSQTDMQDTLTNYVKKRMYNYGMYTLQDRAIPEIKDGLKPVHRRLIWASFVGGYFSSGPFKKCARIVGDTIGKFSPNGDQAVFGALVNLANTANPLFDKQGNFGCKATDDANAAMRYIESRLSKISEKYLLDRDYLAITPMVPNYDGTEQEPIFLPAKLPMILTQGIEGIATGASTNIPSFSLESVRELTKEVLKKKKCTPQMCLDILEFKFGEGGSVLAKDKELLDFYAKGEGRLLTVPDLKYDQREHAIVMTSYSPRLKVDKAIEAGISLSEIKDAEDHTGTSKNGISSIRVLFYLKKSIGYREIEREIIPKLAKKIGNVIPYSIMVSDKKDEDNCSIRYTTIPNIMMDWIAWRIELEEKVVRHLISVEREKIKKYEWLLWGVENLNLIFKALKTKNPDEYLVENGEITEEHAKYLLDGSVRRLSAISGEDVENKIAESKQFIKDMKKDLEDDDSLSARIVRNLK